MNNFLFFGNLVNDSWPIVILQDLDFGRWRFAVICVALSPNCESLEVVGTRKTLQKAYSHYSHQLHLRHSGICQTRTDHQQMIGVPFICVQIGQRLASFIEFSLWQVVRTRPFLLTVAFIITANAVLSSDSDPVERLVAARGLEVYMGIEVDANPDVDVDSNQMVDQSGWAAVEAW